MTKTIMTKTNCICLSCKNQSLKSIDEFSALKRITSDSKPFSSGGLLCLCDNCGLVQKSINQTFIEEVNLIYKNYQPYEIANQNEQKSLNEKNNFISRSDIIVNKIFENFKFNKEKIFKKNILDVGCSYGNTLNAFNRYIKKPNLFGLDLDNKNLTTLKKIQNFKNLYNNLEEMDLTFDFITMIHTFEHIFNPFDYLLSLKKYLTREGLIFIQVPDAENNPIDYLIADHVTHFTKASLESLAVNCGYEVIFISNNLIKKEISMIIKPNIHPEPQFSQLNNQVDFKNIIEKNFSWLKDLIRISLDLKKTEKKFGVYGTSNATVWIIESIGLKPSFFVDDDINRQGKLFYNKPIISKFEIPHDSKVLIPFINDIVKKIIDSAPNKADNFIYIKP